ncbi:hypothetical protein FA13DRAFT_760746 [Coprinellus micaceus]|uniref:Uncharacterized protein n=1 Tax=Coprinellus micaceus TaxID=71717 RepID=A0A4Y7T5G6_COPMI|nr:hypothetical protein FA13DRAFT_760746 [Coprinellus micaceus]
MWGEMKGRVVSVKIRVPRKSAKGAKEKGEAKEVVGVDAPIEQSASVPSRLTRLGSRRSEPKVVTAAAEPSTSTPTEPVEVSMEEDDTDAPSTRTRGVKRKSLVLDEVVVDEAVEPTKDTLPPDEPTKRQKNGEGEERMVDDGGEREVDDKENADDIEQGDTRSSSPDIPLSAVLRSKPEPPHSDSGSIFGMDIDDEVPPTTDEDEVMSTASALPPPPWLSASIRLPSPASPTSPTSPTSPSSPPHYFPPTEAESAPGSQTVPESPEPALALPSLPMEIRALIEAFISRSPVVVVASRSRTADLLPHLELTPTLKTKSGSKALTLSGKGKGKAKTLTEEEQQAEWGYAWLGLFRILALSEESVTSTVKGAQITVRWRFRVEWVRGGEYMFRDAQREVDVGRPWWVSSSRSKPLSSVSSREKGYHRKSGKDEVRTPELYLAHWRAHPSYSRSLPVRPSSSTDATPTVPEDDNTKEDPSLELLPITFTATPFNVFLSPDAFPTGWFCAACGKVNAQNAMRHRRCASLLCAREEGSKVDTFATDLADIRGPHSSSPCVLPFNETWGVVDATSTSWANGMRVLGYYWGGWARPTPLDGAPSKPGAAAASSATLQGSGSAVLPPPSDSTSMATESSQPPQGATATTESNQMQVDPQPNIPVDAQSKSLVTALSTSDALANVQDNGELQMKRINSVWAKHVFTCNLPHLQKFAGELVTRVQTEVELVRGVGDPTSPFYEVFVRHSNAAF